MFQDVHHDVRDHPLSRGEAGVGDVGQRTYQMTTPVQAMTVITTRPTIHRPRPVVTASAGLVKFPPPSLLGPYVLESHSVQVAATTIFS